MAAVAATKKQVANLYQLVRTAHTYEQSRQAILEQCSRIHMQFSKGGDGRIDSACKESEYLTELQKGLAETHPDMTFVVPKERHWFDVAINGIPINLKLSEGGTDNAFNKVSIIYTLTGVETKQKNMNYNQWFSILQELPKKAIRERWSEYHYLVVNKKDCSQILFKSIMDIHEYKSNPCNDLQINWASEFAHKDEYRPDVEYKKTVRELLGTVQLSVRKAMENMKSFADVDLEKEF